MKSFILLILLLFGGGPAYFAQQKIQIHQIDVGTGDAALVNIMNNDGITIQYSILVDAGDSYMNQTVIDYLNANAKHQGGQVYLDYVLTSHYHKDHIGGMVGQKVATTNVGTKRKTCDMVYTGVLSTVSSNVAFYAVLDKGTSYPTSTSLMYDKYVTLAGTRRVTVGQTTIGNVGAVNTIRPSGVYPPPDPPVNQGLSLGGYIDLGTDANGVAVRLRLILADSKVYYPNGTNNTYNVADTLTRDTGKNVRTNRPNANNWGLGWVLEYGAFRWYTAGDVGGYDRNQGTCVSCGANYFDIETPMSQAFTRIYDEPADAMGHICAQKISHHGSCCSSNPVFLQTMKSSCAIFSCGLRTSFGHPTQEVIDRLENCVWTTSPSLTGGIIDAYLITELYTPDRNIDLNTGGTSGNVSYIATDQVVNPAIIEQAHPMANGGVLYKLVDTVPNVNGNVLIVVNASNGGVSIDTQSIYTVNYLKYDGTQLSQTINCHHE